MSDNSQPLSEFASATSMAQRTTILKIERRSNSANDPRTARTDAALVAAFNRLLLADGYETLTPASIASAAGVARSTFYAHYSSKLALLRHVLQLVLEPLADAVDTRRPSNNLELVLDHFWDNRRLARALMAGRPRRILQERLAEMIESNLRRRGFVLPIPLPMAASCIAHGQVAMLDSWLAGRDTCSAAKFAEAIRAVGVASVKALSDKVL